MAESKDLAGEAFELLNSPALEPLPQLSRGNVDVTLVACSQAVFKNMCLIQD